MSLSRAEKLLGAMSPSERKEFQASLQTSKRGSLHALYRLVERAVRQEEAFDKEDAFGKIFGRAYTPREDYLIRNELRLLTTRIHSYLTEQEYHREIAMEEGLREVTLARALLERKLFAEFEGMLEKFWQRARARQDYQTAARLKALEYRYLIIHNEISPEVMERAHQAMLEQLLDLKRCYRNDVAVNQHNRVVCQENLRLMNREATRMEIGIEAGIDFSESDTPYALFYDSTSRAYQTSGEERIGHARSAVEQIRQVAELFPRHMLLGIAVLASNSFAEGRYDEARASFEECLAFAAEHGLPPRVDIVFNYASTLMRFGEYQLVLDLFDKHRAALEAEPKVSFRCECIRCFCHIFLRDPASALAAIPPNITQRPESEYHYFRFLYLIIPYLNNDLESALRECRNFADYFTRHKGELLFPESRSVVGLFRRFFTVVADATDRQSLRADLATITEDLDRVVAAPSDPTDSLYLVWLRREVARLQGVTNQNRRVEPGDNS